MVSRKTGFLIQLQVLQISSNQNNNFPIDVSMQTARAFVVCRPLKMAAGVATDAMWTNACQLMRVTAHAVQVAERAGSIVKSVRGDFLPIFYGF
jgi:hypothetical protein